MDTRTITVISSPPMVKNIAAMSHEDLLAHTLSLQRYSDRVFAALSSQVELIGICRAYLESLFDAHRQGDVQALVALIQKGADICEAPEGSSSLH